MSLDRLLANQFSKAVRDKGRSYFLSGAVTLVDLDEASVLATVRGTTRYEVELQLEGRTLYGSCTCPYVKQNVEPCKHLWATLLKVEAEGGLSAAAQLKKLRLALDIEGNYRDEDDEDHYDGFGDEWYPEPARWPHAATRTRGRSLSWKEQLERLRLADHSSQHSERGWPAGREVLYAINVPDSFARGGLALELLVRDRKKDGDWSKPKLHSIAPDQIARAPDPADRRILASLYGAGQNTYYGFYNGYGINRFQLRGALVDELVPVMGAAGRLRLRTVDRGELTDLAWDAGPPWVLALHITLGDSGKQYVLSGSLRRGEERRPLSSAVLLVPGLVVWPDHVARLDDQGAFEWIRVLRQNGPMLVPRRDKDKLLAELYGLPQLPRIELPAELRVEEVVLPPRPRLVIKPSTAGWRRDRLEAKLSFLYGDLAVPAFPRQRGCFQAKQRRLVVREPQAEEQAEQRLTALGVRRRQAHRAEADDFELVPRNLARIVRELVGEGWLVEAEGSLYRKPGEFKLQLHSGIDWFDIDAAVDFDGQSVPLPSLLDALRKGDTTVRLDDGTLGMLPDEWLRKYGFLARMGRVEDDRVRFSRAQIGLLDALLADQPAVALDETFIRARDEVRRFEGVAPADPPPTFTGELRHYQREGLGWLHFLQRFRFGGCLADDMGLGKTVQVLALLAGRRPGAGADAPAPSLVVVPRSLIFNWKQEAARFTPALKILDHTGLGRAKSAGAFNGYDLILTTYGTLRRDISWLKDYAFDYGILDESQAVKNADSESAKAVRLLKASHRLALSGTPVENHLGELWSLFEFLNPGMLGQASVFQLTAGARAPDPDSRALLARALRPFLLRRTKEQVAPELPPKTEQTLYCELRPEQRKLYDELRDHYRQSLLGRLDADGLRRSRMQVLEALLRLRQAACHPGLIDKKRAGEPSAKLEVLLPQLAEVLDEGHKALVFSQFTSLLAIVRARLDAGGIAYEYLDGRTRDRAARVERFQNDPDCKLFLVSLKAGGVGLNLTAAEYVYLLDPWWNPAVEAQAIDRTHRIGQERPVFAYRVIARDTVEEKVLELQKTKRDLADAIISADNGLIRDLRREDLELLLS